MFFCWRGRVTPQTRHEGSGCEGLRAVDIDGHVSVVGPLGRGDL